MKKLTTQFPPVPEYYKSYGPPQVDCDNPNDPPVLPPLHDLAISYDPPQEPLGKYKSFGVLWDPDELPKTLADQNRKELFERNEILSNNNNNNSSVLNIQKSVDEICNLALQTYVDLLELLKNVDVSAEQTKKKAEEFETIYINLMYLINELRPSQAREILIDMTRSQSQQRKEVAEKLNNLIEKGQKEINDALNKIFAS